MTLTALHSVDGVDENGSVVWCGRNRRNKEKKCSGQLTVLGELY